MASKNIRGLTVEIGGDTTELTSALKSVDKQAKTSSDELGEINRLLKMDPTNTEALSQKMTVLSSSIGTAKDKLEILRSAEKTAREQFEKGEIGEDQMRALQREIVYAENKLSKLEKAFDDTKKAVEDAKKPITDAGKEIKETGNSSQTAAGQTKELSKQVKDLEENLKDAKDAAKDAAKEAAIPFAAVAAAVGASAAAAMGYEDALDAIQIQTGASEAQMKLLKASMDDVFASGLGEDLDDVANTMAVIAQQTHETDPEKLTELAKNALIVKDSFGFEVEEQMRAVKMLMDQFGISSTQAYNLIVQGAQKGLNKNGDLLDVINEYSVHYKNLGYDADEFFNSLYNGTQTGVFSVDKLGDAMKEFGIKARDEAQSTTEAYAALNLDADEMRDMFAAGGARAREAARIVNEALFSMKDEVAQNTVGVALYGTMWEDMGKDAIAAIGNVNGKISSTADAMNDVRAIKMDSASTKWASLGRTLQTEVIIPLGEQFLPTAKKVVSFLTKNSEKLLPTIKSLAKTAASMWAGAKIGAAVSAISKAVSAYKSLKTATTAANAAMSATPWGAVGAAIGLVIGGIGSLIEAHNDEVEAAREAAEAERAAVQERLETAREVCEETRQQYRDMADAAFDSAQSRRRAAAAVDEEYDYYEGLWERLQLLVGANGDVIEGNEEIVELVYGELKDAIGFENNLVDGQIEKYGELSSAIANSIALRRAQSYLDKTQSDYEDAKDSLPQLQTEYEEALALTVDYKQAEIDLQAKKSEAAAVEENFSKQISDENLDYEELLAVWSTFVNERTRIQGEINDLEVWLAENASVAENATNALTAYDAARSTIAEYEALENAVLAEDYGQIKRTYAAATNGMMEDSDSVTLSSLESQAQHFFDEYLRLLEYSKQEGTTVTQEQIENALQEAVKAAYIVVRGARRQDVEIPEGIDEILSLVPSVISPREDTAEETAEAAKAAEKVLPTPRGERNTVLRSPNLLYDPVVWDEYYRAVGAAETAVSSAASSLLSDTGTQKDIAAIAGKIYDKLETISEKVDELELRVDLDGDELTNRLLDRVDRGLGSNAKASKRRTVKG